MRAATRGTPWHIAAPWTRGFMDGLALWRLSPGCRSRVAVVKINEESNAMKCFCDLTAHPEKLDHKIALQQIFQSSSPAQAVAFNLISIVQTSDG